MKIPDWIVYGGALALIIGVTGHWAENSVAPEAPPPPGPGEMALFATFTPFSPSEIITLPLMDKQEKRGTAFSVSKDGEWVVARESLKDCAHPFINVGGNLGVPFTTRQIEGLENYVLAVTSGGGRPLPLANPESLKAGQRGFMPGFPQGYIGEATARLIGETRLRSHRRFEAPETVMAWAVAGRTQNIPGSLNQLLGGPTLNAHSEVVGITIKTKPRRGRIYSSTPQTLTALVSTADKPQEAGAENLLTRRNYGTVSDTLRREYRVVQVGCIKT